MVPMTGAISKLGTNYYLFQGFVQIPGDNPFFLAGSGTLIGSTLVLTLNTSQTARGYPQPSSSSIAIPAIMHVEINPSDLSGTFYEVGHDFDRGVQYFSGAKIHCRHPSTTATLSFKPFVRGLHVTVIARIGLGGRQQDQAPLPARVQARSSPHRRHSPGSGAFSRLAGARGIVVRITRNMGRNPWPPGKLQRS